MSKIQTGVLDQYDAEHFKQYRFGTSGIKGVKNALSCLLSSFMLLIAPFQKSLHSLLLPPNKHDRMETLPPRADRS